MTSPNKSPWDDTTAHRPSTADYEGCALLDHPTRPPVPSQHPTSAQLNTIGFTHVSIGKIVPNAIVSINGGASPTIAYQSQAPSAVTVYTVTRNGPGDISITWPANTYPPPVQQPVAALNVQLGAFNYAIGAINIANGVRVVTTQTAALTDLSFTVQIY